MYLLSLLYEQIDEDRRQRPLAKPIPYSTITATTTTTMTMTTFPTVLLSLALLFCGVSALAPNKVHHAKKPAFDSKRVAFNGMAVASLASALVVGPMADAAEMMAPTPSFESSSLIAERVTREGLYREYDVDLGDQQFDDARSTYKSAKETKTKKGR